MTIDISIRTILRVAFVAAAVVFLFVIRDLIVLLLFAIVLASGIAPIVTWFEKGGVPRLVGLLSVVLVAASALGLFVRAVAPPLLQEFEDFSKNFPAYAQLFVTGLEPIGIAPEGVIGQGVSQALDRVAEYFGRGLLALPAFTFQIFGGAFTTISLLLVTFYLALERDGVEKLLRLLIPEREESYVVDLWRRAQHKIGRWARGQVLLMIFIGVITYLGLTALDVRYALLLAIFAAMLEIVPIVGPVVSGGAAVLVAVFQAPALAVLVLLFYILLQQVEGNLIVPMLYRRVLGLHPVIVIFAFLIGARLGGIIGMILAVPFAAVAMEFLGDFAKGKARI